MLKRLIIPSRGMVSLFWRMPEYPSNSAYSRQLRPPAALGVDDVLFLLGRKARKHPFAPIDIGPTAH